MVFIEGGDDVSEVDGYRIHKFTSVGDGDLKVLIGGTVEVLVVAGGGSGGAGTAGGGGAGGLVYDTSTSLLTDTTFVRVGAGGARVDYPAGGINGDDSIFGDIVAVGGGGGGAEASGLNVDGKNGGSGGGGVAYDGTTLSPGDGSIVNAVTQGYKGGTPSDGSATCGGGGAGAAGTDSGSYAGAGGDGRAISITGTSVYYGGGGGGSHDVTLDNGGQGGGGAGGDYSPISGDTNTGGGGGGGWTNDSSTYGAAGGSGIVIVRYPIADPPTVPRNVFHFRHALTGHDYDGDAAYVETVASTSTAGSTEYRWWCPPEWRDQDLEVLVVGGGGGGGCGSSAFSGAGGGGGGVYHARTVAAEDVTDGLGAVRILVGGGGTGSSDALVPGVRGNTSNFGRFVGVGGGGGASAYGLDHARLLTGGSGGGGGAKGPARDAFPGTSTLGFPGGVKLPGIDLATHDTTYPSTFSFWYTETEDSGGGGVLLLDGEGAFVAGFVSRSPGWEFVDSYSYSDGIIASTQVFAGNTQDNALDTWTHVEFTFDWEANTYAYSVTDGTSTETGTRDLVDHSKGGIRKAALVSVSSQMYMWFSELKFTYPTQADDVIEDFFFGHLRHHDWAVTDPAFGVYKDPVRTSNMKYSGGIASHDVTTTTVIATMHVNVDHRREYLLGGTGGGGAASKGHGVLNSVTGAALTGGASGGGGYANDIVGTRKDLAVYGAGGGGGGGAFDGRMEAHGGCGGYTHVDAKYTDDTASYFPSTFSYKWIEVADSYGGGIRLYDPDGVFVVGFATDTPEWVLDDGDGRTTIRSSGTYERTVRVDFAFDWADGTYTYHVAEQAARTLTYPPAPLTADTTSISGEEYGNGTYVASASSILESIYAPYKAFDDDTSPYWHSADPTYDSSTGTYTGSVSTTVDGVSVPGEWLGIELPSGMYLQHYVVVARSGYFDRRIMNTFTLAGSNDNTTWTLLDERSDVYWSTRARTFEIPQTKSVFRYYRLITTVVGNADESSERTSINIAQWKLYGAPFDVAYESGERALASSASGIKTARFSNYDNGAWVAATPMRMWFYDLKFTYSDDSPGSRVWSDDTMFSDNDTLNVHEWTVNDARFKLYDKSEFSLFDLKHARVLGIEADTTTDVDVAEVRIDARFPSTAGSGSITGNRNAQAHHGGGGGGGGTDIVGASPDSPLSTIREVPKFLYETDLSSSIVDTSSNWDWEGTQNRYETWQVTATSVANSDYPVNNVFTKTDSWRLSDGGNRWIGGGEISDNMITIRYPYPVRMVSYQFLVDDRGFGNWDVEGSNDGSTWTTFHGGVDSEIILAQFGPVYTDFSTTLLFKYFRVHMFGYHSSSGQTAQGLGEWKIFTRTEGYENPPFVAERSVNATGTVWNAHSLNGGWSVSASSYDGTTYENNKQNAFNKTVDSSSDCWHSAATTPSPSNPQWLAVRFPSPVTIHAYNITSRGENGFIWFPSLWRLQGRRPSSASSVESSWVDIEDTDRSETSWVTAETKRFTVPSHTTSYIEFRLLIKGALQNNANSSGEYVCIGDWSLFVTGGRGGAESGGQGGQGGSGSVMVRRARTVASRTVREAFNTDLANFSTTDRGRGRGRRWNEVGDGAVFGSAYEALALAATRSGTLVAVRAWGGISRSVPRTLTPMTGLGEVWTDVGRHPYSPLLYAGIDDTSGNVAIIRSFQTFALTKDVISVATNRVRGTVFGPDGKLYIGGEDNNVYRVHPETLILDGADATFSDATGIVRSLVFDANGKLFVGSSDKNVYRVDPRTMTIDSTFTGSVDQVLSLEYASDGKLYVGENAQLHRVDPLTMTLEATCTVPGSWVRVILDGGDGKLYVGGDDNKVHRVNISTFALDGPTLNATFSEATSNIYDAVMSGGKLFVSSKDHSVYRIEPRNMDAEAVFVTGGDAWSVLIGPDGLLYADSDDGNIYRIDPESMTELSRVPGTGKTFAMTFGPRRDLHDVAYGEGCGTFVAVGDDAVVLRSLDDGRTWADISANLPPFRPRSLRRVIYLGGRRWRVEAWGGNTDVRRRYGGYETQDTHRDHTLFLESDDNGDSWQNPGWALFAEMVYDSGVIDELELTPKFRSTGKVIDLGIGDSIRTLSFDDDDGKLYVGGKDAVVYRVDPATMQLDDAYANATFQISSELTTYTTGSSFDSDGTLVLTSRDDNVYRLDPVTMTELNSLNLGSDATSLAMGDDKIFVGTLSNEVHRIDSGTMIAIEATFTGASGGVWALAYGPDDKLYVGSDDSDVYRVDPTTMALEATFTGASDSIRIITPNSANNLIFVGGLDYNVYRVNPATMELDGGNATFDAAGGVQSVVMGPDGLLYVGSGDGNVYQVDPVNMTKLSRTSGTPGSGVKLDMAFLPHSSGVDTSYAPQKHRHVENAVALVRTTGSSVARIGPPPSQFKLSRIVEESKASKANPQNETNGIGNGNGVRIAVLYASDGDGIHEYRVTDDTDIDLRVTGRTLEMPAVWDAIAVSPDGKYMYAGGRDEGLVFKVDATSFELVTEALPTFTSNTAAFF